MAQSHTNIRPKERFVIVIGPTGFGKSTFITTATNDTSVVVGHGLNPVTSEIRPISIQHPNKNYPIVFVDTPGFNETCKSDTEIITMVSEWFVMVRQQEAIIAGIIYMHRISDNRMTGPLLRNLQSFKNLCGVDAMPNVIVVTTMWSEIREASGAIREKQLIDDFWGGILKGGGNTKRFDDSHQSAWDIIGSLTWGEEEHVLLSKEAVNARLQLNETQFGKTLDKKLKRLIGDQKDASRRLRDQAGRQGNGRAAQEFYDQKDKIERKIEKVAAQFSARFRRRI